MHRRSDNHENIPLKLPVPGKAIVYKGASPVQNEPFTFEKYCAFSTNTRNYWQTLPQPPTVAQIETFMKVCYKPLVVALLLIMLITFHPMTDSTLSLCVIRHLHNQKLTETACLPRIFSCACRD